MENHYFGGRRYSEKTFLLIYDISDNKRRRKMAKLMEGYGYRVQESAFECNISRQKYSQLISRIPSIITNMDNVRIYPMREDEEVLTWNGAVNFLKCDVLIC